MKKNMSLEEMLNYDGFYEPTKLQRLKNNISILYRRMSHKIKDTAAVLRGEKLADNKEYEGAPRVTQEMVEAEPRRWIIEECIPACEILWNKNIYTFMCSDSLDKNAWIEIEIDCLSDENKMILEKIKNDYICYQYHYGCVNISVFGKGKNAQEELIKIANMFVLQDVPSHYATFDMEKVYMICGCSKEVENPDYVPFEEQIANMTFENWGMPIQEPTIMVFDPTKVEKTEEEYISDIGAIKDGDTIYVNEFHYNKHLKYVEYTKNIGNLRK
jgi:hypothetical protein